MRYRDLPPLLAVSAVLLGLSAASLLLPDRELSPNENRYLQQVPRLTLNRILSGRFADEAERYGSDQIVLRDSWMEAASLTRRLAGQREINGVYIGKDGRYFARLTEEEFDQKRYEGNLETVRKFFLSFPENTSHILLVPSPSLILSGLLPDGAPTYDGAARFAQAADVLGGDWMVDVRPALSTLDRPYYLTDHHWTTEGARAAYETWCAAVGIPAVRRELRPVSDTFRGTLYSKVLLPDSPFDTISLPEGCSILSMDRGGTRTDSLYDRSRLEEKDQYAVFLGGNWAEVRIETGVQNGRHLLLVKDSFANCFTPFLTGHFETITLLDLRYFVESVRERIEAGRITDVLVLYEMGNFAGDQNIFKLLL